MTLSAAALVLASASPSVCAEVCYSVDGSGTSVSYEVQQAGAPFRGKFRGIGGEICLAAERVTRVDVWLEPGSVDSGLPEIDAALRGKDFFASNQYPRAAFASQSVEPRGSTQLAHGVLQMKGKRRNLDVSFRLLPDAGSLKVSGALILNRLDYGIGVGEWSNTDWLGGEVKVEFRAALRGR